MMTRKMDSTTAMVVCRPTLSALPLTCKPSKQLTSAMTMAKTGALTMPTQNVVNVTAPESCVRNCAMEMSSTKSDIIAPPARPTISA